MVKSQSTHHFTATATPKAVFRYTQHVNTVVFSSERRTLACTPHVTLRGALAVEGRVLPAFPFTFSMVHAQSSSTWYKRAQSESFRHHSRSDAASLCSCAAIVIQVPFCFFTMSFSHCTSMRVHVAAAAAQPPKTARQHHRVPDGAAQIHPSAHKVGYTGSLSFFYRASLREYQSRCESETGKPTPY